MNNKLEVIGIDHGWSMMKTISQVFVTGVKEITTTPALFGDVLEYEGKFYKGGTVRQEVKDTKVEDDSFYLLTLAAVAKELKRRGLAEAKVFLAPGQIQIGKVNPTVKPLGMATFSCFLFQCRIVQDYVIPKAADDMEIVLTHRRYESFLGKECVCNHRSGYAL